jgi:UDP-N-acetylglucosamine/UDP-N-acetylgalactosamine 4-epimerase
MNTIERMEEMLEQRRSWLVTGAAGFIGSHLVEHLLLRGQVVTGVDDFRTGQPENLEDAIQRAGPVASRSFHFIEGDICDPDVCRAACYGQEMVLHQAALGSVPRSVEDPLSSHLVNVGGFLQLLLTARDLGISRFVFASSSSVYGDCTDAQKVEQSIGTACSPYALTKRIDELYAQLFASLYGIECVGLRYFNVFGRRQDPQGPYAAVIPRWIDSLLKHRQCVIYGDGETSRDFCHVDNVVQANLLAATAPEGGAVVNQVFNIGGGDTLTLNGLFALLRERLSRLDRGIADALPVYQPFRPGDLRHSRANIGKASELLGYRPSHTVSSGLDATLDWYQAQALPISRRSSPAGGRPAARSA